MESATVSHTLSHTLPLRILVADRDERVRRDVRAMLESAGHIVVAELADGARAVEAARKTIPDLALIDIDAPVVDGIEAARILQQELVTGAILISDGADREIIRRAAQAGIFSFLTKPLHPSSLLTTVAIAHSQWIKFADRSEDLLELTEQIRTRKAVGQAKSILMEQHGLKEKQAFREIQIRSMNCHQPMRSVAKAIVSHALRQRQRAG